MALPFPLNTKDNIFFKVLGGNMGHLVVNLSFCLVLILIYNLVMILV